MPNDGRVIYGAALDVPIRTQHAREGLLHRLIDIINPAAIGNDRDIANQVASVDTTPGHYQPFSNRDWSQRATNKAS